MSDKKVIHIYGASGSGTTTLGTYIADRLGYTLLDSDDFYWLPTDPPFVEARPASERLRLMKAAIENADDVIISGSLVDWGDALIPYFTLAVRVVTEQSVRIRRLEEREYARFGGRIMPGGDMYVEHMRFLAWAAEYDTGDIHMRSRAKHDAWEKLLQCPVIRVDGTAALEENLNIIVNYGG